MDYSRLVCVVRGGKTFVNASGLIKKLPDRKERIRNHVMEELFFPALHTHTIAGKSIETGSINQQFFFF